MALSPADRQTFSLKIVSADVDVQTYITAKAQLQAAVDALQAQDQGNANLYAPINDKVNLYQSEISMLDGNQREVITEQDIQDAAAVKIRNHFYPNDTSVTVPSLAGSQNVWTKAKPLAITYAIGKNYTETYTVIQKENDLVNAALASISTAQAQIDVLNTSGLATSAGTGTCSIGSYTTQSTCTAGGGTWTPGTPTLVTDTVTATLLANLKTTINALVAFLTAEAAVIVSNESDTTIKAQNLAALNYINNTIKPALATWLAYPDFNATNINLSNYSTYNTNLNAPTKLHNIQLTALKNALTGRQTFSATRLAQLNVVLGGITQDLTTGDVSASTGLYGRRYNFLILRLDLLNGSLCKLSSMKQASGAQDSIISSIKNAKATYLSVLPTSLLAAPGNGTKLIQVVDASMFAVGDMIYVIAANQEELLRAVASVSGNAVTLNDVVPAKYRPQDQARIYKDIT